LTREQAGHPKLADAEYVGCYTLVRAARAESQFNPFHAVRFCSGTLFLHDRKGRLGPMAESREDSQPCKRLSRQEFLEYLLRGIPQLERLNHKNMPRRMRGWSADLRRKFGKRMRELRREGRIPPSTPNQKFSLPPPYLETVRTQLMRKCFVAYVVAGGDYDKLAPAGVNKQTLTQRICQFKRKLEQAGTADTDVVEAEYALFRFYGLQLERAEMTASLEPPNSVRCEPSQALSTVSQEPLNFAPWEPSRALSQWERDEIAQWCSDCKTRSGQRGKRGGHRTGQDGADTE